MSLNNSTEQQQLAAVLASWQDWRQPPQHRPRLVSALTNGLVNRCWLVAADRPYVVRISHARERGLRLSWEEELRAALAAAGVGLAPTLQHIDPRHGSMVMDWAGSPADIDFLRSESGLVDAAGLLKRLHQVEVPLYEPGYERTVETYLRLAGETSAEDQELLVFARYLDLPHHPRVFCHHDLTAGNLLTLEGRLRLVDWEYARLGHALFDLGSLAEFLQLDADQGAALLGYYGAADALHADLPHMRQFIRRFADLWQRAARQSPSTGRVADAKITS